MQNIEVNKKKLISFSLAMGIFFLLMATIFWWQGKYFIVYLTLGILFIIISILDPFLLTPLYKIWMRLAIVLNWISLRLILVLLFYVIFLFVKIISKLCGKHFLMLKCNKAQKSYWNMRQPATFEKSQYKQQF